MNRASYMIEAVATSPSTIFGCAMHVPPKKHIQPQSTFYSTKKKQEPLNMKLAKPTEEEKEKFVKLYW